MKELQLYKNIVGLLGGGDEEKLEAIKLMQQLLEISKDSGYDLIVLKELIKIVQFDTGEVLYAALEFMEKLFFSRNHGDELAETLIYRVGRSTDLEVCKACLESLRSLIIHMGENSAKHSKQILKLVDLNQSDSLHHINVAILKELEKRVPQRLDGKIATDKN